MDARLREVERAALRDDPDAIALWTAERALRERLRRSRDCGRCEGSGFVWRLRTAVTCRACCGFGRTFGLRIGLAALCGDGSALELLRTTPCPSADDGPSHGRAAREEVLVEGIRRGRIPSEPTPEVFLVDVLEGADRGDDEPDDFATEGCTACTWWLCHRIGCPEVSTLMAFNQLVRPEWGQGPTWAGKAAALSAAGWACRDWRQRQERKRRASTERPMPCPDVNRLTERLVSAGLAWLRERTSEALEAWWALWPRDRQLVRAGRLGPGPPPRRDSDVPEAHDLGDDQDLLRAALRVAESRGLEAELRRAVLDDVRWAAIRPGAERLDG